MIPTLYDLVEGYRKDGRLNAQAIYKQLGVKDPKNARSISAGANLELKVTACMYINYDISYFLKHGVTNQEFNGYCRTALEQAEKELEARGMTIVHDEHDFYFVRNYALECGHLNLDNPHRKGETWISKVYQAYTKVCKNHPGEEVLYKPENCVYAIPARDPNAFFTMADEDRLCALIEEFLFPTTNRDINSDPEFVVPISEEEFWKFYKENVPNLENLSIYQERDKHAYEYHGRYDGGGRLVCALAAFGVTPDMPYLFSTELKNFKAVCTVKAIKVDDSDALKGNFLNCYSALCSLPVAVRVHAISGCTTVHWLHKYGFNESIAFDPSSKDEHFIGRSFDVKHAASSSDK